MGDGQDFAEARAFGDFGQRGARSWQAIVVPEVAFQEAVQRRAVPVLDLQLQPQEEGVVQQRQGGASLPRLGQASEAGQCGHLGFAVGQHDEYQPLGSRWRFSGSKYPEGSQEPLGVRPGASV